LLRDDNHDISGDSPSDDEGSDLQGDDESDGDPDYHAQITPHLPLSLYYPLSH
jgi:hypothetical protein